MTNTYTGVIPDDDEDDDVSDFVMDLAEQREWEDNDALRQILADVPTGWHLIKIANYNYRKLIEIEEYLNDEIGSERWKQVRWRNGYCSYSTGVMVEGIVPAAKLRLRYGQ